MRERERVRDRKILIYDDMFRLNQMNVGVPFTAHIPLKMLLVRVRRTLSLLW
jgi:hypothetical protein